MNNEFTHYQVEWIEADLVAGFWNVKKKRFYDKSSAIEWKYLVDKNGYTKNCIVKKITEITEIIA